MAGAFRREDIGGSHLVKQNPDEAPRSTRELRVNPSNLFRDICFLRSRKRIRECKAGIEWHHALPFDVDLVPVTLVLRCFRDVPWLPVTLLIRADKLCIGQDVAPHCSLDLRFRRVS